MQMHARLPFALSVKWYLASLFLLHHVTLSSTTITLYCKPRHSLFRCRINHLHLIPTNVLFQSLHSQCLGNDLHGRKHLLFVEPLSHDLHSDGRTGVLVWRPEAGVVRIIGADRVKVSIGLVHGRVNPRDGHNASRVVEQAPDLRVR